MWRILSEIILSLTLLVLAVSMQDCVGDTHITREECDNRIMATVDALWRQDYDKALETITPVRDAAYENGWDEQYFWALNLLALTNCRMYDTEEARDLFLTACRFASENMSEEYQMKILSNLSTFYIEEEEYTPARESYGRILEYALRTGDRELAGTAYMNLCTVHMAQARPDSALRCIERALRIIPDSLVLKRMDAQVLRAEALLKRGDVHTARDGLESVVGALRHDSLASPFFEASSLLATLDADAGDISGAVRRAAALPVGDDMVAGKKRLALLHNISRKGGDYRAACLYGDSLRAVEDSLARMRSRLLHDNSQIKFVLMASENKLARQRNMLMSSAVIGIVLIVLTAVIIVHMRQRARRNRQKRIIAEQQRIAELELRRAEDRQRMLETELEASNRELTAKVFNLAHRNDIISETLDFLESLPIASTPEGREACSKLRKQICSEHEIEDFLTHFEKVNSKFIETLHSRHPALSANDVRFLIYIYMQLSNKEISNLLNIPPNSCKKRRQRIAAKLGLEDASRLYGYISGL